MAIYNRGGTTTTELMMPSDNLSSPVKSIQFFPPTTVSGSAVSGSSAGNAKRLSLMNMALLYATLVGVGVVCGYTAFSSVYSQRCADMLDEAEGRYNVTKQHLEHRYKSAMEEHHECLNDESIMLELYELRGRLGTFEALEKKYQQLESMYEATSKQYKEMVQENGVLLHQQKLLQADLDKTKTQTNNLEGAVTVCNQEKDRLAQSLSQQKTAMERVIAKETAKSRKHEDNYEDCKERLEDAILNQSRARAQQRNRAAAAERASAHEEL